MTGEIKTGIRGISFGSLFPKLAKMAHKLSVVHSFQTGDGTHDLKPIVSSHSVNVKFAPNYSRIVGLTNDRTGLPGHRRVSPGRRTRGATHKQQLREIHLGVQPARSMQFSCWVVVTRKMTCICTSTKVDSTITVVCSPNSNAPRSRRTSSPFATELNVINNRLSRPLCVALLRR